MKADKEFHYFSSAFSGQNSSTFNAVFIMLYFMKIVLATGNAHKKRELMQILPEHTLLLPNEAGVAENWDFEETEDTFLGNSLGKAKSLQKLCALPVLADDSGLVVPALGGEPGIFSARYGSDIHGRMLGDTERNHYLLEKMEHLTDRTAFFVCCMTLMLDEQRIFTVQETLHGEIQHELTGNGGFGYDPIFYIPEIGCTTAELLEEEKNHISHRGRAGMRISALLENVTQTDTLDARNIKRRI